MALPSVEVSFLETDERFEPVQDEYHSVSNRTGMRSKLVLWCSEVKDKFSCGWCTFLSFGIPLLLPSALLTVVVFLDPVAFGTLGGYHLAGILLSFTSIVFIIVGLVIYQVNRQKRIQREKLENNKSDMSQDSQTPSTPPAHFPPKTDSPAHRPNLLNVEPVYDALALPSARNLPQRPVVPPSVKTELCAVFVLDNVKNVPTKTTSIVRNFGRPLPRPLETLTLHA